MGKITVALNLTSLGRGGLQVSTLALGCAPLGNLFRVVSQEDAVEALQVSFDKGVRYFDTAPHYGLGLSERRVGNFLEGVPRADVVVSSKVGRLIRPNPQFTGGLDDQGFAVSAENYRVLDYSYDATMISIEESLERLGTDYLDVVYVHDADDHENEALEGAFPALEKLRSEGVIRSYGAGMNQSAMLARFARLTDLDVVMVAGRFSLLDQPAVKDLLPIASEKNISVVAAGVFNSGILATDDPQPGARYDYEPASTEILARAQRLAVACVENGVTLPQVAAQFPFVHRAIKTVCLGARNGEQASRNVELFTQEVPRETYQILADRGLISSEVLNY
jgi:D-threo-aldose 1-dehydrogenase